MTDDEVAKLDKMFQKKVLYKHGDLSLLGGRADLVHHYITRHHKTCRWYIPNGIPLTDKQHREIHKSKSKEYKEKIIEIKGEDWLEDLREQRNKLPRRIKFKEVKNYLQGNLDNYI